jgi:creatinine amidohydrolase
VLFVVVLAQVDGRPQSPATRGILLEDMTWRQAEQILTPDAVVVIPLGAAAQQHGPHLKLNTDWTIAEHLKRIVAERTPAIVAPTIPYHHHPEFVEYPGSATISLEAARDRIAHACRSLARYGPRRFYVLNTSHSTDALEDAARQLAGDGILLRYTSSRDIVAPLEQRLPDEGYSHAGEAETSMMLFIDAPSVDMSRAQASSGTWRGDVFSPRLPPQHTYSPTGAWGNPAIATPDKGKNSWKCSSRR